MNKILRNFIIRGLPKRDYAEIILFIGLFFWSIPASAQIKIYINTDLEGVSGVYKFEQTRTKDTPINIQACEYFMEDLAAVVRGLRDGGATEIIVVDGHGSQAVIPHLMEPGAKYVTGQPKIFGEGWRLDSTFSGLVMFGYHAMMGTPDGVLCHTQDSKAENRYWYNGVESGELVQGVSMAGLEGVPLIMVTGDVSTCREAVRFFGNEFITVATKQGISREAAILYPFDETRKALYEGAKKAISVISSCKPYVLKLPVTCKLEYLDLSSASPEPKKVVKEWISLDGKNLLWP